MKPGESFSDLLSFASGFTEFAYTVLLSKRTEVLAKCDRVPRIQLQTVVWQFRVYLILNRFENRIRIDGLRLTLYSL
jgi:hypothetical protein